MFRQTVSQDLPTRFVLIEPSHAGNVGAAARALKVMGFDDLVLVRPRWPDVLQRPEAIERASGATDVLARARLVETLDAALEGMTHLCATAMTPRDFGPPVAAPRDHLAALAPRMRAASTGGVAFLFGPERYGMANEDVYRCHVCLRIPTAPDYGSLNLAAAVQLIAYEWRLALGGIGAMPARARARGPMAEPPADAPAVSAMLAHWEEALVAVGFLDPAAPKKLMPRLRRLLQRAAPTVPEVHILRGVARAMIDAARGVRR
ncbi:tRNA (cytidine/uridine-2'-O-)-methyltransferase TrmJ [Tepidimonas thermarum]|uniref:tRNA (Cytidine/uridine-2'-O-)-methyltransferase TrmJ n=1 Tax=Tepidimonas thermarum TaxID=335431 RepID=A0A554X4Z4_9BURK|nr:tRNA (cytidine/uridine-2'-O-)-methyltransferase TrmJ [Tepidimonas thermarum]